VTAY